MGKLLVAKEIGAVNLDGKRICAAFVGVLVFMSTTTDSRQTCQPEWYFDIVVGRCTPCTDICLHAAIQGTERECQQKCPNFKPAGNGNDNVSNDPEDHKHVAIAILGTLIGTIAVVGSGILIWKRNTDLREVICRRVCRNRNFEQGDRDETEPKELLVCGNLDSIPEPDNGNSGNSGDGTNIENIEMTSMVPPTDNINFAQVSDTNCPVYKPAF